MANAVMIRPVSRSVRDVVFRFDGRRVPHARSVALVGPFNRWDTSVHRLTRQPDQWWTISLVLTPGEYPYLFVVDGVPWNDPAGDGRVPCEWGGEYSLRLVR
jgi:1,4-alpha-glucan branching enzyme